MAEKEYNRLTRGRLRWTSANTGVLVLSPAIGSTMIARSSLWLGKDHILSLDSTGYTESYKRFYLRDIQAITACRTSRRLILNIIFGGCLALSGVIAIAANDTAASWVFGSLGALFLILLVINVLKGPTCRCYLRTAVQAEHLPSLNRVNKLRKVMDRLRPLIAATQGQLTAEEISTRMQAVAAAIPAPAPPTAAPASRPVQYVIDEPNLPPRMTS